MARASDIFLLALLWSGGAFAQAPAVYKISGVVVDHRTQAPLPSVLVSISATNNRNERADPLVVMTNGDGRFQFFDLAAGKYALSAQRRSEQPHGFKAHGQFSTAIATGPGLDSEHIVFPLPAECRIAGSVLDEDGDPVPNALVFLLSNQVIEGKHRIRVQTQQNSSASGAFHFGHLRPGSFYLAVSARPWYAGSASYFGRSGNDGSPPIMQRVDPPAIVDVAYPITYSGDVTDPAAAQPIVLTEGTNLTSHITLHAVPAVHVSVPDPEPAPSTDPPNSRLRGRSMRLTAVGPGDVPIMAQSIFLGPPPAGNGAESEEEIKGIAPGTYLLGSSQLTVTATGSAAFATDPAVDVHGRVVYDGVSPKQNLRLQLIGAGQQQATRIQPDGTFAFQEPLRPGRYRLGLPGGNELMVRSVASGKDGKAEKVLDIPKGAANPQEITVTVAPASTSTVSGIVTKGGHPLSGAMVLLIPGTADQGAAIGRDQSDSDGTFNIPNVTAGHYTLVAIDRGDSDATADLEYQDAAVMKPYLAHGQPVDVPVSKPIAIEAVVSGGN